MFYQLLILIPLHFSKIINAILRRDDAWIGLSDIQNENRFVFIDGVAATTKNVGWKPGEPSGDGDCVHINWPGFPHNSANDYPCNSNAHALCEKAVLYEEYC